VKDRRRQDKSQERLAQAQRLESLGQLAGGVAHDFNNLLAVILNYAEFAAEELAAATESDWAGRSESAHDDLEQISRAGERAASLTRQLLAFARREVVQPQVLDLDTVITAVEEMLRRTLGEHVELAISLAGGLHPVLADPGRLEQVLVNLAVNARDAMPGGGKLTVKTANLTTDEAAQLSYKGMPAADYVRIDITDTGTGIPPEIVDKIFEPFFSTKEVGKGTGLGLSTVYGIVKQTGGFVYVDSEAGKGTSFHIFFPRHRPELEVQPEPQAANGAAKGAAAEPPKPRADLTGQGTILLVEDEDGLRSLNARGLRSRGYSVIEASNGVEAMEALEEKDGAVDLVVSDVVMPEMDGPTLLREMRKRNPNLKIIFVSGYAEEAFDKSLPENEQFAFLPKPFALSALVEKVKETMTS
jgi:two-component system, cell cycle sensor histidine kinase and response regulator CckA